MVESHEEIIKRTNLLGTKVESHEEIIKRTNLLGTKETSMVESQI
jgi:hypothetical protein